MKKALIIVSILLAGFAGLTIYNTFTLGKVKESPTADIKPTVQSVFQQTQNAPRLSEFQGFDYINNLVIGNKLHFTPISAVSNTSLGADIGDIWFDAVNSSLRFVDGNSADGQEFVFKDFGGDLVLDDGEIVQTGITNTYIKTINLTSANLLAGDSVSIKTGESGVLPIALRAYYDYATAAYSTAASDSTCIYTYSNSVKTKIAYMADGILAKTNDDNSSVGLNIVSYSDAQPFWINLKNMDTGGGTLRLDFIYIKL